MAKWILFFLVFTLSSCASVPDDRSRIVGSWKIVSFDIEFKDSGERRAIYGKSPKGYIIFTAEGRTMSYLEAETRKAPNTDEERAAAFRTMLAYTGKYRIEGDRFTTSVDGAWNVAWVGTDQARTFKLDGNRLEIVTQWNPAPLYNNRMTRGVLVCEREK
jgi:hypothetical protein